MMLVPHDVKLTFSEQLLHSFFAPFILIHSFFIRKRESHVKGWGLRRENAQTTVSYSLRSIRSRVP